ncbi:uncharacterized protein Gasu_55560 [Galdieria sulphuraria]|uniref:C-CAP/cofactor C-like domain-containing protein n=1 Tax=Galdieria sulphuraria TaxID=130081 RepID=M2VUM4_GALSU|nr:uncharacterized protein Gasu_55560 [Galdieria sulphuraria]EME26871.1 hypothetical protein Gasu_55560 [Galdieria sulphuraria]|eukprot:XP_005703391.1 hypothetical protein Gasu_55560 [Galdieria sulphuraria]
MESNSSTAWNFEDGALYVRRSFFEHGVTVPLVTSTMLKTEALANVFEELFNLATVVDNRLVVQLDQWNDACKRHLALTKLQAQHIVHTLYVVAPEIRNEQDWIPFVELLVFVRLQACARRLATPVRPSTDDVFPKNTPLTGSPLAQDENNRSNFAYSNRSSSIRLERGTFTFYKETMFVVNNLEVILGDLVRLYEVLERVEQQVGDVMDTRDKKDNNETIQWYILRPECLKHLSFLFLASVAHQPISWKDWIGIWIQRHGSSPLSIETWSALLGNALKLTAQQSGGIAPSPVDPTLELSQLTRCTILRAGTEGEPLSHRVVRIRNCQEVYIYLLNGMDCVSVEGCSDCIIFIGAAYCISVTNCETVKIVSTSKFLRITNVVDSTFHLCVNHQPALLGDNRGIRLAPFNAFYPYLEEHMKSCGVSTVFNYWNEPFVVLDSSYPPSTVANILPPEQLCPFAVPIHNSDGVTKKNPVQLPKEYLDAVDEKAKSTWNELYNIIFVNGSYPLEI